MRDSGGFEDITDGAGWRGKPDYSIELPYGFMPFARIVFGYSPEPHSMKEPKSLY